MKHICLFSGGAASSYMSWLVAQEQDKKDVVLLHTPTYSEDPDTDRFRKEVAEYIGIPITIQEDGRDVWDLIDYNRAIPNIHFPFCTRILKMEQTEKFLKSLNEDFTLYYGFGPEEWRRVQRASARNMQVGRKVRFPLWEKNIQNSKIKEIIKNEWRICLPSTYKYLQHSNCIPCWKGSKRHFHQVWKYYPEQFWRAVEKEEQWGPYTLFDKPLRELAEVWAHNNEFDEGQMSLFSTDESIPCMCSL